MRSWSSSAPATSSTTGTWRASRPPSTRWASADRGPTEDELWAVGGRDALREHLRTLVDAALESKEQEVGETDWTQIERLILLRTIDSLWVEHLTELDDMRHGITLRGYAQQDPLNEFRREAFALYSELRGFIRHQVANTIFRVTVTRQAPPPPTPMAMPDAATLAALRSDGDDGRPPAEGAAILAAGCSRRLPAGRPRPALGTGRSRGPRDAGRPGRRRWDGESRARPDRATPRTVGGWVATTSAGAGRG